jgi:transmembrane sensor
MHERERETLMEAAQRWELTLSKGGAAEKAQFAAWIRRSPEHLQAYLQHLALQTELEGVDAEKELALDVLLRKALTNVVPLTPPVSAHREPSRSGFLRWPRYAYAAAAVALLTFATVSFYWFHRAPVWTDYVTAVGEQRRITLSDGSIIELNTASHIRVALGPRARNVELVAGEAEFVVQHRADWPYRVQLRNGAVEDLGTQFSIYLRSDATVAVSVLEGRVQFLPNSQSPHSAETDSTAPPEMQVQAGEAVYLDPAGAVVRRSKVNAMEFASWRQHRLWFDSSSLSEITTEFNRYNSRKIILAPGMDAAEKRYTASWDPYDPEAFIRYLKSDSSLTIRSGDHWVVQRSQ